MVLHRGVGHCAFVATLFLYEDQTDTALATATVTATTDRGGWPSVYMMAIRLSVSRSSKCERCWGGGVSQVVDARTRSRSRSPTRCSDMQDRATGRANSRHASPVSIAQARALPETTLALICCNGTSTIVRKGMGWAQGGCGYGVWVWVRVWVWVWVWVWWYGVWYGYLSRLQLAVHVTYVHGCIHQA